MAFLDSIKEYLYNKELNKTINSSVKIKRGLNAKSAIKSISILYAENKPFDHQEIESYISKLQNKGITVHALIYSEAKFAKGEQAENVFTTKDLGLSGLPKNERILKFNFHESDLFYNLLDPQLKVASFMNLLNKSNFRIGLSTDKKTGCDLMIKLEQYNFKQFIKTSDSILKSMNIKKQNEPSI